ncbi:hypothetical protein A5675_24945 [Mycobacterium malmoense]|nr:hypothetical protein A5675_24945 [Mycobacterium malmoense]
MRPGLGGLGGLLGGGATAAHPAAEVCAASAPLTDMAGVPMAVPGPLPVGAPVPTATGAPAAPACPSMQA